jgi:hypothetical protein
MFGHQHTTDFRNAFPARKHFYASRVLIRARWTRRTPLSKPVKALEPKRTMSPGTRDNVRRPMPGAHAQEGRSRALAHDPNPLSPWTDEKSQVGKGDGYHYPHQHPPDFRNAVVEARETSIPEDSARAAKIVCGARRAAPDRRPCGGPSVAALVTLATPAGDAVTITDADLDRR